jgi:hypothetical protein
MSYAKGGQTKRGGVVSFRLINEKKSILSRLFKEKEVTKFCSLRAKSFCGHCCIIIAVFVF